jgi:single-strand DNA-binding protein
MRGVNKVMLVGNATRDAERKQTESGKTVTVIGLATNRQSHGAEVTQYHRIVCWDTLAETVSTYVKKGRLLYVEGRLEYRTFADDEGRSRGVAEIVADHVQFLDRPHANANADSSASDTEALDLEDIAL